MESASAGGRRRSASASSRSAGTYGGLPLPRRVRRPAARPGGQRPRGRVRARQDPRDRARPGGRRAALARRNVIGCKRLCVDTGYYETFNRPNVTLVDVSDDADRARSRRPACGPRARTTQFDCHRLRHRLRRHDRRAAADRHPRPRRPARCKDKWREGPKTYLGLGVAGFPNLFTITGPGSPSVLTNMLPSIEQHVEWIADCIGYLRDERRSAASRPQPRGRGRLGRRTSTRSPAARSARPATPGTSAPTSRASRACSCRYIGGFPAYVERAKPWWRTATRDFVGPRGCQFCAETAPRLRPLVGPQADDLTQ